MERGNLLPKGRWHAMTKEMQLLLSLQTGSSQQTLKNAGEGNQRWDEVSWYRMRQSTFGRRAQSDRAGSRGGLGCPAGLHGLLLDQVCSEGNMIVLWLKASPVNRDYPEHPCLPGLLSMAELVQQEHTQQAASHNEGLHQGCLCQAIKSKLRVSIPIHSKAGKSPPFSSYSQKRKVWHSFSMLLSVSVSLYQPILLLLGVPHPFDPLQRPTSLGTFHSETPLLVGEQHCCLVWKESFTRL